MKYFFRNHHLEEKITSQNILDPDLRVNQSQTTCSFCNYGIYKTKLSELEISSCKG